MKITKEFLESRNACIDGIKWVEENSMLNMEALPFLQKLIENEKLDWASWLITRVMTRPQYLKYAIYAAEQVIDIYENKYPEDKRPREAIEAAKKVLENDSAENRAAAYADAHAYAAAYAADAAARDADAAAYAATRAAAYADAHAARDAYAAARAAAYADAAARDAAYADAHAAYAAAYAADAAARDAEAAVRKEMQLKILNYGISLLTDFEEGEENE